MIEVTLDELEGLKFAKFAVTYMPCGHFCADGPANEEMMIASHTLACIRR